MNSNLKVQQRRGAGIHFVLCSQPSIAQYKFYNFNEFCGHKNSAQDTSLSKKILPASILSTPQSDAG